MDDDIFQNPRDRYEWLDRLRVQQCFDLMKLGVLGPFGCRDCPFSIGRTNLTVATPPDSNG